MKTQTEKGPASRPCAHPISEVYDEEDKGAIEVSTPCPAVAVGDASANFPAICRIPCKGIRCHIPELCCHRPWGYQGTGT